MRIWENFWNYELSDLGIQGYVRQECLTYKSTIKIFISNNSILET